MSKDEAVKYYVQFLVAWITNKCDVEFDTITEYEIVRLIYDSAQSFIEEKKIYDK